MFSEIIVFVVVLIYFCYGTSKGSKIRKLPPGPIGLPLVGYLPFMGKIPSLTITNLAKKYGNIFSVYLGKYL
ncbi:unnamed protein product, partial [Allacma fusca]